MHSVIMWASPCVAARLSLSSLWSGFPRLHFLWLRRGVVKGGLREPHAGGTHSAADQQLQHPPTHWGTPMCLGARGPWQQGPQPACPPHAARRRLGHDWPPAIHAQERRGAARRFAPQAAGEILQPNPHQTRLRSGPLL